MSDYLAKRMAKITKKRKRTPDILLALERPQKKQKSPSIDAKLDKQLLESKENYRILHNRYTRTQSFLEGLDSTSEDLTAKVDQLDYVLEDGRGAIFKMKQQLKELLEKKE